ncbi:MAG: signal transduction histidine kinase [Verrucomicrobiales bacterium]|jgi:signal transduction histidine kinase
MHEMDPGESGKGRVAREAVAVAMSSSVPDGSAQGGDDLHRRRDAVAWSTRATALVSLLLAAGLAVMIFKPGLHSVAISAGMEMRLCCVIDSMALGIAILSFAALISRNTASPDRLNLISACMLGVLAGLVLPIDLFLASSNSTATTALVAATRICLVVLTVGVSYRRSLERVDRFGRTVAVVVAASIATAGVIGVAIRLGSFDQIEFLQFTLRLSSVLLLLGSLRLVAFSLRAREPRGYVLALALIAIAAADGHATFIDEVSLSAVAGKAMRLVVISAILIYTVVELRDLAMRERDLAMRERALTLLAQNESERAADRLVAQMTFQERFVHDTRNALLAIQGGLRSLNSGSDRPMVTALYKEVERLRILLLGDDGDPLPVTFDVVEALEPMFSCYTASGQQIEVMATGPVWARGRPSIVAEVTQNLIENAIEHGDGGEITVWIFRHENVAEVRVADRGDGVDSDLRDSLFDYGTSGGSGSGVGLHISRRLIESQGGSIEVTDRHGGGAISTFTLPSPARLQVPKYAESLDLR